MHSRVPGNGFKNVFIFVINLDDFVSERSGKIGKNINGPFSFNQYQKPHKSALIQYCKTIKHENSQGNEYFL